MGLRTLYFDESGQTGARLLDADQTHFSVGSTDLSDVEAHALIEKHFPRYKGGDLKFRKLFKRPSNYSALVDFAGSVGKQPERFFCFLIDKRFANLTRMVDWLVEPLERAAGYDWYKDDYGRRWVNMLYYGFSLPGGDGLLSEISSLYERFANDVSPATLEQMQRRYAEISETAPNELRTFMGLVSDGASSFERFHSLRDFKDPNDIHVTSVVTSVGWWRALHDDDFVVVHDQSTHFFKRKGIWDEVTSANVRQGVVRVGSKSIQFPLRVRETVEGNSEHHPALQVCDLVAGFVAKAKSGRLTAEEKSVVDRMLQAGFGQLNFDGILPGTDFVDGPPAVADGPDAVDMVVDLTRSPQS